MATIIQMPRIKPRPNTKIKSPVGGTAEILFFSGVRYVRSDEVVEKIRENAVKRRRKGQ